MKLVVTILRYFVSIVFLILGAIKLNDPLGFSYKLNEYFAADVLNLPSLIPFSLYIAIILVLFEMTLGLLLLFGFKRRFTMWYLLLLITFFALLTFYSAFFDKVKDCGCFGDAMKIKPWQSFGKDIFLLVLILILFFKQEYIKPLLDKKYTKITVFSFISVCLCVIYYVLIHLPIIDFRPYKIGANIPKQMEIPLNAPKSIYEDVWYYRVDGKVNQYTTDEAPWYLPGAEFVDRTTTLISKGYEPPIHDFTIEKDGGDYTDDILSMEKVVIIITHNLKKSEKIGLQKLEKLHQKALKNGYEVIGLTASLDEIIDLTTKQNNITFDFYTCDETTLKTIVRANPGVLILNKGTIVDKVSWTDIDNLNLK